jgi:AraC-like DNA-binding protein
MEHRGDHRIRAGDVVMADSEVPMGLDIRKRYEFVNLAMPPDWLKTWVPNPQWLVGRSLLDHSRWGPALSSYLAMLAPQVGAHLPVSGEAVASHVGGLLALITEDIRGGTAKLSKASASLQQRAVDCIVQRCQEPALMAPDVATSIGVSVRTLHRTLAMNGTSFSAVLMKARVDAATRMLESPLFRRLTVGEIGRRAGFSDASHFSRTIRSVCGTTPQQLRVRRSGNPLSQEQFTQKL